MDLEILTQKAAEKLAGFDSFKHKVKFNFKEAGILFIDGVTGTVNNADDPADATMTLSWADFEKLTKGELNPTMAYMSGKIKIEGDMAVIMGLQDLVKKLRS